MHLNGHLNWCDYERLAASNNVQDKSMGKIPANNLEYWIEISCSLMTGDSKQVKSTKLNSLLLWISYVYPLKQINLNKNRMLI